MSTQKTSENLHSATSSVASADGQEPCRLQDGVQTDLFGQEVPLVSLSQAQEIKKGKDDLRHLWPVFFNLIRECCPPTIFGEQVASAIRFGWLDDLQTDLEAEGYAAAAVVLPSGGVGAPHKRDRLFFVADTLGKGLQGHGKSGQEQVSQERQRGKRHSAESSLWNSSVGDAEHDGSSGTEIGRSIAQAVNDCQEGQDFPQQPEGASRSEESGDIRFWEDTTTIHCRDGKSGQEQVSQERQRGKRHSAESSLWNSSVGYSEHDGSHEAEIRRSTGPGEAEGRMLELERSDSVFWGSSEVIYCRDGKYRPIPTEPALFPLAHGVSNRVGILRGAGNAIVPQAAAQIIKAYM